MANQATYIDLTEHGMGTDTHNLQDTIRAPELQSLRE